MSRRSEGARRRRCPVQLIDYLCKFVFVARHTFSMTDGGGVDLQMPQEATRTARIEARITPDALRVVKRAAALQGRSVSDFVVAAAQEAAHRTIDEAQVIRLSVEDQQRFVELLLNPPAVAPALKRAKRAHARLFASSR